MFLCKNSYYIPKIYEKNPVTACIAIVKAPVIV
jgi:hypothetical protein